MAKLSYFIYYPSIKLLFFLNRLIGRVILILLVKKNYFTSKILFLLDTFALKCRFMDNIQQKKRSSFLGRPSFNMVLFAVFILQSHQMRCSLEELPCRLTFSELRRSFVEVRKDSIQFLRVLRVCLNIHFLSPDG